MRARRSRATALTARERTIFAALADSYCAPEPALPAVAQTDALAFVDRLVAGSPRVNRIGFRVILRALDLAPLVRGFGSTFSRLPSARRGDFLRSLDKSRWLLPRVTSNLLKTIAIMSYYGDDRVLLAVGYDREANLARARSLRREEGRP